MSEQADQVGGKVEITATAEVIPAAQVAASEQEDEEGEADAGDGRQP